MPGDNGAPFRRGGPGDRGLGFDAIWEWNLRTGELVWARGLEERFGYDDSDVVADLTWWRERVHPDDRGHVEEELESQLASDRSWEAEFRFQRSDGEYVEVSLRAAIVREDGEPGRLIGTMIDLEARGRLGRTLEELNQRYRMLVEQNLVGISLIQEGEFVYVNPRMAELYGYAQEELVGADPGRLVPESTQEMALAAIRRLVDGETDEATFTGEAVREDDETVYIEAHLKRTRYRGAPAFIGVTVDITDQVEAEQAREKSERLFHAVFENANEGIVIADDDGTFVDANSAACELFGLERGSIVGQSIDEFDDVDLDFEGPRGFFRKAGEGRGRFTLVRPEGEHRIVEYAATADILPGHHLSMLRDVTDRERQEAALEDERARLDFLNAMLRHHVLNGMNIVLAMVDHLAADAEGRRLDRLETIRHRGTAIVDLIQTIRSLVRTIRTGEARSFQPVDLVASLDRPVEAAMADYGAATVTLEGVANDAGLHVSADAMLSTVFEELLDNAIVHADSAEPEVEIRVEADEETVSVHVVDAGPGVPGAVREDLFVEGTTSGGSGFGLNVVHLLVELYGGELEIRDREPRGTAVTVTLPRAEPDEE